MEQAFYIEEGGALRATELTRGPWSPDHQHAGPPAGLIARALERVTAELGSQVVRVSLELQRPVPIGLLHVAVRVSRSGNKVQWLEAELCDGDGKQLILGRALCVRPGIVPVPEVAAHASPQPVDPGDSQPFEFPFFAPGPGYHTAMEQRIARGPFGSGSVAMWMRMRHPLVAGEAPSALQRVMVIADSGNGVSAALDITRYTFVNPDLTVSLHRLPRGEWVCLDARTVLQDHGVGMAESRVLDEHGEIGRSVQNLIIQRRRQ